MTTEMSPVQVKAELLARMRAKDLAGTLELIADDAVYFWSNGAAMFGKQAISRGLAANFSAIKDDTYDISDAVWLVTSPDAAACVFQFHWTGVIDGAPTSGEGRGTSVLRRGPHGWQLVHENLSTGAWR